jgi:tol-pal system protein YbgF
MNPWRLLLLVALMVPATSFAQKKEIQELQRDMGLLSEQVREIQRVQNEKLTALQVLLQQTFDAASKANTSVAVLESRIADTFRQQEKNVMAPIAGVNTKVDQMASEFGALRETVADTHARLGKLQQQIIDLGNAVKTMQAPAAPPPPSAGIQGASGAPPVPAEVLYSNAMRDKSGGKPDLAMQQFRDYLQYYGTTELAPNAQFYVAEIYYSRGDLDNALKEYDALLEKFPENNKTADALYMKGQTLVKMGKRTAGAQEFREVVKRFPRSDVATKARAQLRAMGLSATAPASARRK